MASFRRASAAAAVLAAVAVLLVSCAPVALAQTCTSLLGVSINEQTFTTALINFTNQVYLVGAYQLPSTIKNTTQFSSFQFTYTVPDQTGVSTPNSVRFAIYTDDAADTLVAQSVLLTIKSGVTGDQTLVGHVQGTALALLPTTKYRIAIWTEYPYITYVNSLANEPTLYTVYNASEGFTGAILEAGPNTPIQFPITYDGCSSASMNGDPVITGFHGQHFLVHGLPQRVYNILSLIELQLNCRFIPLQAGQAMNSSQQASVRQHQANLLSTLSTAGAGAASRLPSTTSWSHDGLYMGETSVQLAGHKLLIQPGAYVSGFEFVQLDGVQLAVSSKAVQLSDGSTILYSSSSVVQVISAHVSFLLVNSDDFLNIHSAQLTVPSAADVDGLLGQTADREFTVQKTAAFTQHVEADFLLPEGEDDIWSSSGEHIKYVAP